MKTLVLNPFAGEAKEVERCRTVARPDTEIVFDNIADVYPLNYVTYIYYRHRCADAVVDRVVRAQEEGFDGVFIAEPVPDRPVAGNVVDVIGLDEDGFAQLSGVQQRFDVAVQRIEAAVVAYQVPDSGALHGVPDSRAVFECNGHRLLAHDVFASKGGGDGHLGVHRIRGADVDGIDVRTSSTPP